MSKLSLNSLSSQAGLKLRFFFLQPLGSRDDELAPQGLENVAGFLHPGYSAGRSMWERPERLLNCISAALWTLDLVDDLELMKCARCSRNTETPVLVCEVGR